MHRGSPWACSWRRCSGCVVATSPPWRCCFVDGVLDHRLVHRCVVQRLLAGELPARSSPPTSTRRSSYAPYGIAVLVTVVDIADRVADTPSSWRRSRSPRWRGAGWSSLVLDAAVGRRYLVKAYAWRAVVQPGGMLDWSRSFGVHARATACTAVVLTLAYLWLPYMVLPVYAGLDRLPTSHARGIRRPRRRPCRTSPARPAGDLAVDRRRHDLHLLACRSVTTSPCQIVGGKLPGARQRRATERRRHGQCPAAPRRAWGGHGRLPAPGAPTAWATCEAGTWPPGRGRCAWWALGARARVHLRAAGCRRW